MEGERPASRLTEESPRALVSASRIAEKRPGLPADHPRFSIGTKSQCSGPMYNWRGRQIF